MSRRHDKVERRTTPSTSQAHIGASLFHQQGHVIPTPTETGQMQWQWCFFCVVIVSTVRVVGIVLHKGEASLNNRLQMRFHFKKVFHSEKAEDKYPWSSDRRRSLNPLRLYVERWIRESFRGKRKNVASSIELVHQFIQGFVNCSSSKRGNEIIDGIL